MNIWKLILLIPTLYTHVLLAETFSYPLKNVESVIISAGIEFEVRCGEDSKLEITTESDNNFKVSINDNKLEIKGNRNFSWFFFSWDDIDVKADITLNKSLERISVSSGSEGKMDSCYSSGENLKLSASSGSSIDINNNQSAINQLEVHLSSGAKIGLKNSPKVSKLELNASSGSRFEADKEITIKVAEVRVSSGASVKICGTSEFSGSASSGGNVSVPNKTTLVDIKTSSGGAINTNC